MILKILPSLLLLMTLESDIQSKKMLSIWLIFFLQFDKFRLLLLVLSIIHFLCESVRRLSCNQLILNMTNTPSGGYGMPFSPERAKVVEFPAMEDTDCCLSEKNPSGLEESQKSGATTNTVCGARNPFYNAQE
jgi:hypothetical protein